MQGGAYAGNLDDHDAHSDPQATRFDDGRGHFVRCEQLLLANFDAIDDGDCGSRRGHREHEADGAPL